MEELWVDNDVFNYLCKASCLQEVLQSVPYTLCTTELVQGEAEAASSVLQSAIDAMRQGRITVHPLGKPPLDVPLPRVGGLSPADHSLITCAHHLGGQVLTNDERLIRQCTAEGVGCKPFREFLEECEQNGWLSSQTVEGLRRLCGA